MIFIGGDARQLEVITKCIELDATVKVIGFDQTQKPLEGVLHVALQGDILSEADVIVLPVAGCDDEGNILTPFSSHSWALNDDLFAAIRKDTLVFTGIAKKLLKSKSEELGFKLIELMERDEIAIYNSIPTAEGAVMMAIQNTDITLHGSSCVVLGLGRTGFTLASTLQALGATVRVGVRREVHMARAIQMGWKPFATTDFKLYEGQIDLIFNTIPTMIVTAQIISKLPRETVIIDLASAPGGTDFRFAERRGVKALLAPGLPGIVAPKTAGKIIGNTICQLVLEEFHLRGDEQ